MGEWAGGWVGGWVAVLPTLNILSHDETIFTAALCAQLKTLFLAIFK